MIDDPLLKDAQRLWAELAGAPITFSAASIEVAVSAKSMLCPPGWVGVVTLQDTAIATAPDSGCAEIVRQALDGLPIAAMTDPTAVRAKLPVADILGPATLAYCDTARFRPSAPGAVESIPADHPDLVAFLATVPVEDANEAGLDDITSPAFVVRVGTHVVAAAGYELWPGDIAHLSVLTAPEQRRRGLARAVAAAAAADALTADLLLQWRARPEASRRTAASLGFRELGSQLSIRLQPTAKP